MNFLKKDKIQNPPYDYYFLLNLDEREYPKYLAKLFYLRTGEKLPLSRKFKVERGKLKGCRAGSRVDCRVDFSLPNILNIFNGDFVIDKTKCKTFNQKIQWIKLYGVTDLMRRCTDKVAVRDYVRERIGEEYLKPVLQICDTFDQIDFDKLPNSFVIKCNHGCKWQYIVKDKEKYLSVPRLIDITRRQITGWLSQGFWVFEGFELEYKGIEPKIIIEPLIRDENNSNCDELNIYCFNGIPKICLRLYGAIDKAVTLYDENLQIIDDVLSIGDKKLKIKVDELVKKANELSKELSKDFKFVRVDWMVHKNTLYFEELTFTPYSGFKKGLNKTFNEQFSELIHLERYKND